MARAPSTLRIRATWSLCALVLLACAGGRGIDRAAIPPSARVSFAALLAGRQEAMIAALEDGGVAVASSTPSNEDLVVQVFDAAGAQRFSAPLAASSARAAVTALASASGVIVAAVVDRVAAPPFTALRIVALDAANGAMRWEAPLRGHFSALAIHIERDARVRVEGEYHGSVEAEGFTLPSTRGDQVVVPLERAMIELAQGRVVALRAVSDAHAPVPRACRHAICEREAREQVVEPQRVTRAVPFGAPEDGYRVEGAWFAVEPGNNNWIVARVERGASAAGAQPSERLRYASQVAGATLDLRVGPSGRTFVLVQSFGEVVSVDRRELAAKRDQPFAVLVALDAP